MKAALLLTLALSFGAVAWSAPPADLPSAKASSRQLYAAGHAALDRQDWLGALQQFRALESDLARTQAPGRDAALYWQAYALDRTGDRRGAQGLCQKLIADFPDSPWVDDAQELLGTAAKDGDRLIALDALMATTPERAVPLLKQVLAGAHSDKVKKRALFVLVQLAPSEAGGAIDALLGGNNSPALKREAIQTLALAGKDASMDRLVDYYRRESDASLKRAVLDSGLVSGRADLLVQLAREEHDPELQSHAIRLLGAMGQSAQIVSLYPELSDVDAQRSAIDALAMAGDAGGLAHLAAASGPPALRVHAVRALAIVPAERATPALVGLYAAAQPSQVRRAVIDALVVANAADALLALYRQEQDPELKRALLHALGTTGNEAALQAIGETLK